MDQLKDQMCLSGPLSGPCWIFFHISPGQFIIAFFLVLPLLRLFSTFLSVRCAKFSSKCYLGITFLVQKYYFYSCFAVFSLAFFLITLQNGNKSLGFIIRWQTTSNKMTKWKKRASFLEPKYKEMRNGLTLFHSTVELMGIIRILENTGSQSCSYRCHSQVRVRCVLWNSFVYLDFFQLCGFGYLTILTTAYHFSRSSIHSYFFDSYSFHGM